MYGIRAKKPRQAQRCWVDTRQITIWLARSLVGISLESKVAGGGGEGPMAQKAPKGPFDSAAPDLNLWIWSWPAHLATRAWWSTLVVVAAALQTGTMDADVSRRMEPIRGYNLM